MENMKRIYYFVDKYFIGRIILRRISKSGV
jgi:hypothetical protein